MKKNTCQLFLLSNLADEITRIRNKTIGFNTELYDDSWSVADPPEFALKKKFEIFYPFFQKSELESKNIKKLNKKVRKKNI